MESLMGIKNRLNSVKNIGQITKAMEVVAATKMRRSQEVALKTRPYGFTALSILADMVNFVGADILKQSPLTDHRPIHRSLVVLVLSDRGLAGSFNAQVLRAIDHLPEQDKGNFTSDHQYSFAAVGQKGVSYLTRKKLKTENFFTGFGEFVQPSETEPLADFLIDGFTKKKWDRVLVVSTHFITTLKQEVVTRHLLPLNVNDIEQTLAETVPTTGRFSEFQRANYTTNSAAVFKEYIFEPSAESLVEEILPLLFKMQVYQLILEANASEHSARMVAMKNATENAKTITDDLTLEYNKARQAGITKEIIEITSAQSALI